MSPAPPHRWSVLVVEDDPGIAELVRGRLEALGCDCTLAATGAQARAALEARKPDLLVLDYSLPDMKADELVEQPGLPPFMITTGRGDESVVVRLMRAGARDYVIKDGTFLDVLPAAAARVLREIETERSLAAARADLESRLREKDALLREIHHRVKNNLQIISSLIRLQTPADAPEAARSILEDIQRRVGAMSLIHETLYGSENLAGVDFCSYLGALSRNLEGALAPHGGSVKIECRGEGLSLPIDQAVPFGLLASELITNALKHAFPAGGRPDGRIRVSATLVAGGGAVLEISDNGVGIRADCLEPGTERGCLGIQLVHLLSDQLGAECRTESGSGGTTWRVTLPD